MENFSEYQINKKLLLKEIEIFNDEEFKLIKESISIAEKAHKDQTRDGMHAKKIPYVIHCVRAASWLIKQNIHDYKIIIAEILHDTLEDTSLTPEEIEEKFGRRIRELVESVTRSKVENETEEQKIINKPISFKKVLKSEKATRLLKTADLLDNMRSWKEISENDPLFNKLPRWISEAEEYYIPIAESVHTNAVNEMKIIMTTISKKIKK